jgi:hypothetical protein
MLINIKLIMKMVKMALAGNILNGSWKRNEKSRPGMNIQSILNTVPLYTCILPTSYCAHKSLTTEITCAISKEIPQ